MVKYMLQFELRYTDIINGRESWPNKKTTISIHDNYDETITEGNNILEKLKNVFEIRFNDKFSKRDNLVTNCCYPTKGVQYFFKIEELKFDDLHEAINVAIGARDRVLRFNEEKEEE